MRYTVRYGKDIYDYFYINEKELTKEEKEEKKISELNVFNCLFNDMILCNNILKIIDYNELEEIIPNYDEKKDEYKEEYQFFIVNLNYDEDTTRKCLEITGNTLYYSNELDVYIIGVCDWGMSRSLILTNIDLIKEA